MEPVQVIYKTCLFRYAKENQDKKIHQVFQALRAWIIRFGLNPKEVLLIGIPTLDSKELDMYECCIEFPIPMMEEDSDIQGKTLPGGTYAVLRIEKTQTKSGMRSADFMRTTFPITI